MNDFLMSALPWVAIALIFVVMYFKLERDKKQADSFEVKDINDDLYGAKKKKEYDYSTTGMTVGFCIGVGLGWLEILNMRLGIPYGMLLGLVIGMFIKKK